MVNRFLPFIVALVVLSSLFSYSIVVFKAKISATIEQPNVKQSAYFDIESFLSGQKLAEDIAGTIPSKNNSLLRNTNKTEQAIFRLAVNMQQLKAENAAEERIRRISKRRIRRFTDKLPSIADNIGASMFFEEKEKTLVQKDIEKMLKYAKKHKGIPYVWGGSSVKGFDCSGFTRHTFNHLGVKIPRNSHLQSKLGKVIPLAQAQPGDMVFFGKKAGDTYKTNHTGIIVENKGGAIKMIHSTYRGVVVDEVMKINSYARRFLFVKRILK